MPQSPGYLTIAGKWQHYDRDNDQVLAKYFLVGLFTVDDEWLAWDYTDDDGNFILGPVTNPGVALRVRIYTYVYYACASGNYEVMVVQPDGSSWDDTWRHDEDIGSYSDGYHELEQILEVPQGLNWLDAWWIKDDLDKGFRKASDPAGDYIADWDPDWGRSSMFCVCHLLSLWPCDTTGHIQLAKKAAEGSPDIVLHEMGHAVMWNLYGGDWPISCLWYASGYCIEHYIPKDSGDKCAWTEGWASFWAMYVKDDPHLLGYNVENKTWESPGWDDGDEVEGRVAGALWDIYDDDDDVYDLYDGGFDDIWDTIYNETDDDFADFWESWKTRGHNTGDAFYSLYQNTICYGPNLWEGSNILCYFGETADFEEALNNIGPNGENVTEIIWARADWTDGDWWFYNVAQNYSSPAEFTHLGTGKAYIIVVSEDCAWELPSCADIGSAASSLDLFEGGNIIHYSGATAEILQALNNIGPGGLDVAEIIWARADWTDGDWWFYNVAQKYSSPAKFTDLQTGRAYNLVVSEDCTWYLL